MDFSVIIQRLNDLTAFMNGVRTLSKKIYELPPSTVGNKLVAVYNETSLDTEQFNLTDALGGMYSLINGITAIGDITRDGSDFTFEVGFEWKINGIEYANAAIIRTINNAGTGNHRIDIAVCDTNDDIYIVEGFEVPISTAVVMPPTPPNTLLVSIFSIFESVVSTPVNPAVLGMYIKKDEFQENFITSGTGAIDLVLDTEMTSFRISDNDITTINKTVPNSAYVSVIGYVGKLLLIINDTDSPITIKHDLVDWGFRFPNNADFVLGVNEVLTMRQTKTDAPHFDVLAVGRMVTDSLQNLQSVLEEGNSALFTGLAGMFQVTFADADTGMHEAALEQTAGGFIHSYSQTLQGCSMTKTDEVTFDYQQAVCGVRSRDGDNAPILNIQKYIFDITSSTSGATSFDLPDPILDKEITFMPYLSSYNGVINLRNCSEYLRLRTAYTLTNTTALQKIFNTGTNGNGAFNVFNGKRYRLTLNAHFSNLPSISKTMDFGILGDAVADKVFGISNAVIATTASNSRQMTITSFASTTIATSSPFTLARIQLTLEFECTSSGKVIPCVSLSSADAGMQTGVGSFCTLEEIDESTVEFSENTD